jgi:hypothetical protein
VTPLGLPGPEHFIFIPIVFLLGVALGWWLGGNAVRQQLEKLHQRAKE